MEQKTFHRQSRKAVMKRRKGGKKKKTPDLNEGKEQRTLMIWTGITQAD